MRGQNYFDGVGGAGETTLVGGGVKLHWWGGGQWNNCTVVIIMLGVLETCSTCRLPIA